MRPAEISIRQWQENYRAGIYRDKDVNIQQAAGWWRWNCRDDALAGRLKLIAPLVMRIKEPFLLDHYCVWFANEGKWRKAVYDSVRFEPLDGGPDDIRFFMVDYRNPDEPDKWALYTKRFGLHTAEFGCGHVHDMAKYIANLARELEQDVRPAFLDEKAAAVEYILRRNTILPPCALRREGAHSYSFLDRDDGRRKTVHVAASLEDAPLGFQADGAVLINGFHVCCPEDMELSPAKQRQTAGRSRKKREQER